MKSRARPRHPVALWLLLSSLLLACASVLGIDERRADTADSYPEQGYAGCRAGDCSGCLDVHRQECEVRSSCAEAGERSSCAGCVCESCVNQLVECQNEPGCGEIWECLRETRCDLSERVSGNCLESCAGVIQANGGVGGSAWRSAIGVRTCAASSVCLSCLAPQVQQSALSCNQQNGCQDCDNCFSQCLCSGERFGVCQQACGDQAPPAGCSEDNGCASCTNCFDTCACNGESFEQCSELCKAPDDPGPDPECSAETSCTDCDGCEAHCVCSGGEADECSELCSTPGHDQACEFDAGAGYALCTQCSSCLADCTCKGGELSQCMRQCGNQECCGTNGCITGSVTACTCNSPAESCFTTAYVDCSFSGCDSCACERCPGQLAVCEDTDGCKAVFNCMRTTECHGAACLAQCGVTASPGAFAVAEALWACYHGSNCSCKGGPTDATISCPGPQGDVDCPGFESATASIGACCTQAASGGSQTEGAGVGADEHPCGLSLSRYVPGARSCEPREQANEPRFLAETCPDQVVSGELYNGMTLPGCCRPDHTCGVYDAVTGLGCLSASSFGFPTITCL